MKLHIDKIRCFWCAGFKHSSIMFNMDQNNSGKWNGGLEKSVKIKMQILGPSLL